MRWLKLALVLLLLLLGAALVPVRRVADDEMSPSLQRGDLVWVLPVQPLRGDVVLLRDPLDPDRTVLRRTLAGAGGKVRWDEGGVRVDGKRVRQSDMGDADGDAVRKEVIWSKPPARAREWLVRLRRPAVYWARDVVEIPDGHWYLLADDRDRAVDSRWWGPVPQSDLEGVVRFRIGRPDEWRSWWSVEKGWE